MHSVWIKNISGSEYINENLGARLDALEGKQLSQVEIPAWGENSEILSNIAGGVLQIGDSNEYFDDINRQIDHLKGKIPHSVTPTSERNVTWTQMKTFFTANSNTSRMYYWDFGDTYDIWLDFAGRKFYIPNLEKSSADGIEFEAGYKALANVNEAPRTRITTNRIGAKLHKRYISLMTARPDYLDNTNWKDEDFGDVQVKMFDWDGNETTDYTQCRETRMLFEPLYLYEVFGAAFFIPPEFPARPAVTIQGITNASGVATVSASGHKLKPGCYVKISGADQGGYNGEFRVTEIVSSTQFKIQVDSSLLNPTGSMVFEECEENWEMHAVGVPQHDGYSADFISNSQIKWLKGDWIEADCSLNPATMPYYAGMHFTEIWAVIKHPVGCRMKMQIRIDMFK